MALELTLGLMVLLLAVLVPWAVDSLRHPLVNTSARGSTLSARAWDLGRWCAVAMLLPLLAMLALAASRYDYLQGSPPPEWSLTVPVALQVVGCVLIWLVLWRPDRIGWGRALIVAGFVVLSILSYSAWPQFMRALVYVMEPMDLQLLPPPPTVPVIVCAVLAGWVVLLVSTLVGAGSPRWRGGR